MSNEIKNTLFRFVSMRSPELTTDHDSNTGFILQPSDASGVFNDAVTNRLPEVSKLEALKTASTTFVPLTLEGIKALNTSLYSFSVWIAKNRNRTSETELTAKLNAVTNLDTNTSLVWQNLYYQIITQNDFYSKELLMQLLFANHIVENHQTADIEKLLKAKIILPKILFIEDSSTNNSGSNNQPLVAIPAKAVSFANPAMQRQEIVAALESDNKVFEKLKNELKKAEKAYKKAYKIEFDKQYKAHEAIIKPILDDYAKDVDDANNNWCNTKDPNITFDPNDPCSQPPKVKKPEIPELKFNFHEELDKDFLATQLSNESLEVLETLLDPSLLTKKVKIAEQERLIQDIIPILDFDSYDNAYNSLQRIIDVNGDIILTNTVEDSETVIVVGDIEMEVDSNASNLAPFEYEAKIVETGLYNDDILLSIMVGIPNPSWKIASINYKLTRLDDSFEDGTSSFVVHKTGYDHLRKISMLGIDTDFKELSATLQFQNGEERTLVVENFVLTSIYRGFLFNYVEVDEETGNGSSVDPDEPFIPSGFGVKQLGIADYNKVEQSIQGYVEGEVAHIENVMAREFKEKSTRRLRRREETNTSSTETEREKLTDTTTVDRFEMQSEVANVIQESQDFNAGTSVDAGFTGTGYSVNMGAFANYATHNSTEESALQAVTNAKEITERALDRVVNKVKEERIEKIVEEFEENNTHGFDNRKGDKHVVGVYRWVDKIFKNQIVNYGKRLMFEFAVPEPAKLHKLALKSFKGNNALEKPEDPRKSEDFKLENYADLTLDTVGDAKLKYWTGKYNVVFDSIPKEEITVGKSFSIQGNTSDYENGIVDGEISIPKGYAATKCKANFSAGEDDLNAYAKYVSVHIGDKTFSSTINTVKLSVNSVYENIGAFTEQIPVSFLMVDYFVGSLNASVKCQRTTEAEIQWQQETFNAIIKAYEEAQSAYEQKLAEQKASGVQILGNNPGFYRQIENTILRKNCISYLLDNNPNAKRTFGKNFYTSNNNSSPLTFRNTKINQNSDLDNYAAFVKFMEQAFEWNIMSYNFYPYYWADRDNWENMHLYNDTHDHVFKAFMQSGMARVIVTVRPGFEEAVRYYMQTGQIWNGGEVPVIEDELYLSIVDELRAPEGEKVGKAWWSRVPTALTILQAQSIGLNVTKALPFNEDLSDFEDPDSVPQSAEIELTEAQIGATQNTGTARLLGQITGNNGIEAKIVLKRIDGSIQDLTYTDTNGQWELNNLPTGRFELLLDADNDFPSDTYQVSSGSKEQVVELADDQTVQVDLTIDIIA
ncbi:MAG: carboxypeptidase-like regulatory domain-containing protein [Xanthomarina gelatinilytica]|uniref:carboxypeptidase-like regulatory domain-containing protein n=1 Tax=Xanthomarina gelatinilytica TaxID=1137281 RepID=UPI003A8668A8